MMEQTKNISQIDPRMAVEKRYQEYVQPTKHKRSEELGANHFFGLYKNLLITIAAVGVSIMFSFYLFKEVKKIREEIRIIKAQEPDQDLIEKVEENSEAVKAIETKLDQLINALESRERRRVSAMSQPILQPEQQLSPQVTEQEYQNQQILNQSQQQQNISQQNISQQNISQPQPQSQMLHTQIPQSQIPVMGGRLAGSAITMDDAGIIRI